MIGRYRFKVQIPSLETLSVLVVSCRRSRTKLKKRLKNQTHKYEIQSRFSGSKGKRRIILWCLHLHWVRIHLLLILSISFSSIKSVESLLSRGRRFMKEWIFLSLTEQKPPHIFLVYDLGPQRSGNIRNKRVCVTL